MSKPTTTYSKRREFDVTMGRMLQDSDKARQGWRKLLTPDLLRTNLIRCSVYLTAYEVLLQALIEQPLSFFAHDFTDQGEPISSESYREHVLSLAKHPYQASAKWFKGMGALTDDDLTLLMEIREHRNHVAHNAPKIIMSAGEDVNLHLLLSISELVTKIDRWWIREIVIPTNAPFDGGDLDGEHSESFSMRMIVLNLLISVAVGDEEKLSEVEAVYEKALQILKGG